MTWRDARPCGREQLDQAGPAADAGGEPTRCPSADRTRDHDAGPNRAQRARAAQVMMRSVFDSWVLLFTLGWQHVDKKLDIRYAGQQSWPMFEVVWSITERNVLRARIGAERGGYTCSGGVCRFESPFTGAKLQLISRF